MLETVFRSEMRTLTNLFLVMAMATVLVACASSPEVTNRPVNEYLAFLQSHPGADLRGAKEAKAKASFERYLTNFTEQNVKENTAKVYASDAFLNDTLKTLHGSQEIEQYFLKVVGGADSINVKILGVARSENDYYFRWIMDLKYKAVDRGKTIHTVGVTHVRFNREGQVLVHQDFWDAASGFFQHVPVIGGGIGFIKGRL